MIFPEKHLMLRESLLWFWSIIINLLDKPKSVDKLWKEFNMINENDWIYISFDDLILTLNFIYLLWIIEMIDNRIVLNNNITLDNNIIELCN